MVLHNVCSIHLLSPLFDHLDHQGVHWMQVVEALSTYIVDGHIEGVSDRLEEPRPSLAAILSMPKEEASLPFASSLHESSEIYLAVARSVEQLTDAETAGQLLIKSFETPAIGQDLQVSNLPLMQLVWACCCRMTKAVPSHECIWCRLSNLSVLNVHCGTQAMAISEEQSASHRLLCSSG